MRNALWDALRERDFRLIWFASVLSDLGTWMQISALAIFVTESTGQARWTGIASTITYVTAGLFSPIGGVLADRFDRRRLTITASASELVIGLALTASFASNWRSPLLLISIAGAQGAAGSIVRPALQAMVPDLVSKTRSAHAALLEAVSWNVGRALGPIIAVFVTHVGSYSMVFLLNAISFGLVAVALCLMKARPPHHHEGGTAAERLRIGWQGLWRNRICSWGTVLATVEISLIAPFIALIPAMGQLTLHASASGSGLLFLGQGIGSALGVVIVGSLMHRLGAGRSFLWMMAILPPLLIAYALSPDLLCAVVIIVALSGAHSVVLALATSFMQRYADDDIRGRVMGLHKAITITSYGIASSALAVFAASVGLRTTFVLTAISTLGFLVWMALTHRSELHTLASIGDGTELTPEPELLREPLISDDN